MIEPERILAETDVRHVEHRPRLASTSDTALDLAAEPGLATPALVVTDEQTAGRGRGANRWWSGAGALTFSLILDADGLGVSLRDGPRLSLATAVAVSGGLERFAGGMPLGVKWPNDVLADGRKLCGILIEAPAAVGNVPRRLIVGVGVNVNNRRSAAPAELRPRLTSLLDLSGASLDPGDVLLALLQELGQRFDQLAAGDPRLPDAWRQRCVLRGRSVRVEEGSREVQGTCEGIEASGALVVRDGTQVTRLVSGVIVEVGP